MLSTRSADTTGKVAEVERHESRLAQARDWYLKSVDALGSDAWGKDTLCAGWTAQHIVAHVATGDQLFRTRVLDAAGRDRGGEDLPADFADRQRRFQDALGWDPARLKAHAHQEAQQMVDVLIDVIEKKPETMITVPFGTVPLPVARALRLNEYIIHGHDLGPAIGQSPETPPWFIDRALDETVTLLMRLHQRSPHKGKAASFHIHRTDGEGEWTIKAQSGEAIKEPGHGKADVAMRGTGEGLYWVLMGRGRPEEHGVEVHGDRALAGAFKEWFPGP